MPQLDSSSPEFEQIDKAMAEWRQGDVALKEHWFTHIADPSKAVTYESGQAQGNVQPIITEVDGLVVVSQSCDIVRSCLERHFLEVAPMVEVSPSVLQEIKKRLRPAYAFVPATEGSNLVADLDRIMTVDKAVAATWDRTQGCRTGEEARAFQQALQRKYTRFAFPDDFTRCASKLLTRLQEKHDRRSMEGDALRALREIRVTAAPSWDAPKVGLFFWFIRDEIESDPSEYSWSALLEAWLKLLPPGGRFSTIDGQIVFLEDLTAKDYVGSDPLDLDHLSGKDNLAT